MITFIFFVSDDPKSISISDQKLSTWKNHVKELEKHAKSYDEDHSEYEDVEENETDVTSVLTAMINKTALKVKIISLNLFHFSSFSASYERR